MIRTIVVASDAHIDHVTAGVSRAEETRGALMKAAHAALASRRTQGNHSTAFLFLGDLCDPDNRGRTFEAQRIAIEVATMLQTAGVDSYWLAGNHDVVDDGTGATTLTPLRGLGASVAVIESPEVFEVFPGWPTMFLPYPSLARNYSPAAFAGEWPGPVMMVVGHLSVPGVQPGEETAEMPRGRDVRFPVEETAHVVLRMNGHYHRAQEAPQEQGRPIIIPGSLASLTFGEERNPTPGFVVLEV